MFGHTAHIQASKIDLMYEEKKTKTAKSIQIKLFGFPPVVTAYLILLVVFLIALVSTAVISDQTGGTKVSEAFSMLLDNGKLVLGALFGALTANYVSKQ